MIINFIKNLIYGQTLGSTRSPGWRKVRREHIRKYPECMISGSKRKLEVHHILPVHLFPENELDPDNLVTLRKEYHFIFGHLGNYRSYNTNLAEDIIIWRKKINARKIQ